MTYFEIKGELQAFDEIEDYYFTFLSTSCGYNVCHCIRKFSLNKGVLLRHEGVCYRVCIS